MAKKKGRLERILSTSYKTRKFTSTKNLKRDFLYLNKIIKGRLKSFEKHGVSEGFSEKWQKGLGSLKGLSRAEILEKINNATAYLRGSYSTYEGYATFDKGRRAEIEKLMNHKFESDEQYWKFRRFMDAMAERMGDLWKYVSNIILEVADNATGANIDYYKIMENWEDFLMEEENGKAMWQNLRKNDYVSGYHVSGYHEDELYRLTKGDIKKLKLPTLKNWNKAISKATPKERDIWLKLIGKK